MTKKNRGKRDRKIATNGNNCADAYERRPSNPFEKYRRVIEERDRRESEHFGVVSRLFEQLVDDAINN